MALPEIDALYYTDGNPEFQLVSHWIAMAAPRLIHGQVVFGEPYHKKLEDELDDWNDPSLP